MFSIEPETGIIRVNNELDYEKIRCVIDPAYMSTVVPAMAPVDLYCVKRTIADVLSQPMSN